MVADAANSRGGTWGPDGTIIFAPTTGSGLVRVSASGGTPTPLTKLGAGTSSHRYPKLLPDGRHFVFFAMGGVDTQGAYLGTIDGPDIQRLASADAAPAFLAPDTLLLVEQGSLVAHHFDPAKGLSLGEGTLIAQHAGYDGATSMSAVATSASGAVLYRGGGALLRQLTWVDRQGHKLGTLGDADESQSSPSLSPDGKRATVFRNLQGNSDIWIVDEVRMTRLTFDAALDQYPLWSPDGSRIVFRSNRKQGSSFGLYSRSLSGSTDELIYTSYFFDRQLRTRVSGGIATSSRSVSIKNRPSFATS